VRALATFRCLTIASTCPVNAATELTAGSARPESALIAGLRQALRRRSPTSVGVHSWIISSVEKFGYLLRNLVGDSRLPVRFEQGLVGIEVGVIVDNGIPRHFRVPVQPHLHLLAAKTCVRYRSNVKGLVNVSVDFFAAALEMPPCGR
jgi:hypothetical protein